MRRIRETERGRGKEREMLIDRRLVTGASHLMVKDVEGCVHVVSRVT